MNLKFYLTKTRLSQRELAEKLGTSEPMISKFSNYKCLPVPEDMKKLCKVLDCNVLDIYEKNEITFIEKKPKRAIADLSEYKLTVHLPNEYRELFEPKTLRKLGYHNLVDLMERLVIPKLQRKKAKLDTLQNKSNLTTEIVS